MYPHKPFSLYMTSDQRTRNQRHSLDSIPCKWKECRERPTIKDTLICNYYQFKEQEEAAEDKSSFSSQKLFLLLLLLLRHNLLVFLLLLHNASPVLLLTHPPELILNTTDTRTNPDHRVRPGKSRVLKCIRKGRQTDRER